MSRSISLAAAARRALSPHRSSTFRLIMKLLLDCWIAILDLFNAITLSPSLDLLHKQQAWVADLHTATPHAGHDGPVFAPPAQPQDPGEVLTCDYSPMGKEWQPCSTPHSRSCWLAGPGGQQFDISTDYETKVPTGITRKVRLFLVRRCVA